MKDSIKTSAFNWGVLADTSSNAPGMEVTVRNQIRIRFTMIASQGDHLTSSIKHISLFSLLASLIVSSEAISQCIANHKPVCISTNK